MSPLKASAKIIIYIICIYLQILGECETSRILNVPLNNLEEETQLNVIANIKHKLEQTEKRELSASTEFEFYNKNSNLYSLLMLDKKSGELKAKRPLDRDTICESYQLCCNANEINCPLHFLVKVRENRGSIYLANFTFHLIDKNDNRPKFSRNLVNVHISENLPPGKKIQLDLAKDADAGINGIREYKIPSLRNHRKIPFVIKTVYDNQRITQVYLETTESLDREKQAFYSITVEASDATDSDILKVNVTVDDENDNSPIFLNDTFSRSLPENELINHEIARVKAIDKDSFDNAFVTYSFDSISLMEPFEIGHTDGIIRLRAPLNYEQKSKYQLTIIAKDKGVPERSATLKANIFVTDVNDCFPVISVNSENGLNHRYEVPENENKKFIIATIGVTDEDSGENGRVNCILKENGPDDNFLLETLGASGAYTLVSQKEFDREEKSLYKVIIECSDGGMISNTMRKEIDVHVTDKNDNKPVFKQSGYSFHIEENNDIGYEIGILLAEDADIGRNGRVTYRLQDQQSEQCFHISSSGMLKAGCKFDRELRDQYVLSVIAEDGGKPSLSSTASVTVSILDQNDEAPIFNGGSSTVQKFVREDVAVNKLIHELQATDADIGNNGRITFKLLNITNSFKVSQDGKLTVIKSLDRETRSFYRLLVEARDHGKPPRSATATVLIDVSDVNDNKPRFIFPTETTAALNISTDFVPGNTITRVVATDLDKDENATIRYRIVPQNESSGASSTSAINKFLSPTHMFVIEEDSGDLKLNSPLDPKQFSYMLKIEARDCGNPPKSDVRILLIKVIPASMNQRKMRFVPRNVPGIVMVLVAGLAVLVLMVLLLLILFLANKRFSLNRNRGRYRSGSKEVVHPPSYTDVISEHKGGATTMSAQSSLLSNNTNTLSLKNKPSDCQLNTLSKKQMDASLDQRTLLLKMEDLPLGAYLDKKSTYVPNSYLQTSEMMKQTDSDQSYCQLHLSNIYQTTQPSLHNSGTIQRSKNLSLPQEAYTSLNPSSVSVATTAQSLALNSCDYAKLGTFKATVGGGNYPISDTLMSKTTFTSGPKTLKYPYDSISHV